MKNLITTSIITALMVFAKESNAQFHELSKESLVRHVYALADDSMGGRNTATPGGLMAAKYISEEYRKLGLIPKGGNNSYLQDFTFYAGKEYLGKNLLAINGSKLIVGKDY